MEAVKREHVYTAGGNVNYKWVDKEIVVYIRLNTTEPWKEWINAFHSNLEETGYYYSKWRNSGKENQTLNILTHKWELSYEDAKA